MVHKAYTALFDSQYPQTFDNDILSRSISDSIYQKQRYEAVKYQKLYNIEKIRKQNRELVIQSQRYLFLFVWPLSFSLLLEYATIAEKVENNTNYNKK